MFRRLELIHQLSPKKSRTLLKVLGKSVNANQPLPAWSWKSGLMGISYAGVSEAWASINVPWRTLYKNCRFYFTESEWKRYGRPTVAACQKTRQQYRVICIKERSVEVLYRDEFQIAVRPKKRKAGLTRHGEHGLMLIETELSPIGKFPGIVISNNEP